MSSQKELKENLEAGTAIGSITSVYQEIASLRMNQLREKVAKVREFLDGVATIYYHVKAAYVAGVQRQLMAGKKTLASASFIRRNGKQVLVFLSANEHLYGTLILDIWRAVLHDLREGKAEAVVVGSFGRYLLGNENIRSKVAFFDLNDDKPESGQIKKITDFISQYERIIVYHGRMISVLNQEPSISEVSGGVTLRQQVTQARSYLFEPTPAKILEFFETEIIAALFNQTVLEHQLARFAARMVAMDQATENSRQVCSKIEKELRALRRRLLNRKQMEVFAGFTLWSDQLAGGQSGEGQA
jgi:F-type H+-transporting ATPase subunit gamma